MIKLSCVYIWLWVSGLNLLSWSSMTDVLHTVTRKCTVLSENIAPRESPLRPRTNRAILFKSVSVARPVRNQPRFFLSRQQLRTLLQHLYYTDGIPHSLCIATRYGLDGSGIEHRWQRGFPHLSRPALRPTQPSIQWVPSFFLGVKVAEACVKHLPPSRVEVKETVELYFTPCLGLHGLILGKTYPYLYL
jgi:hypothetical protein